MLTIKDVAAAAGVSPTTVSLIINNRAEEKRISPDTVERVMQTMQELGYQPNISARRLRSSDEQNVVVAFYWPLDYRSTLLGDFLSGMQKALRAKGQRCELMVQTYENDKLELSAGPILKNAFNGVIIGATSKHDQEYLETLSPRMPLLLINRGSERHSTVGVDNDKVGMRAAGLIRQKGYTSVAIMVAEHPYVAMAERTVSFLGACKKLGIRTDPAWTISAPNTMAGGAIAAESYCVMQDRPRMLYCESDVMAQGALFTLNNNKFRMPEDMELLCINMHVEESMEFQTPSVSTISLPLDKISSIAVSTMLDKIAQGDMSPIHIVVEPVIHLRKSFSL